MFVAVTVIIYGCAGLCFHSVTFLFLLVPTCVQLRLRSDKSVSHMQRLQSSTQVDHSLHRPKVVVVSSFMLYLWQLLTEGHSFTTLSSTVLSALNHTNV